MWGLLALFLYAASGCGPVWYLDPGFAERVAAKERKPLLLYFKAWDSTFHRNMTLEVLNNPSVKSELTGTVNAELEYAYFPEYCKRFNVRQAQVCVMCNPDGQRVSTPLDVSPVPTPEQFLNWLKRAKAEAMSSVTTAPSKK